jgi:synaptic vesicle membrane protein VAT-1
MRAIQVDSPGGHDRLALVERPDPVPAPGEVLVRVEASGVNYADVMVRMGLYASAKQYVGWPIVPGFEVAGTVGAVGAGVDDLQVGSDVIAVSRFGAYADRLVVPRWQVIPRPPPLDAPTAAGVPVAFLTAWYAVRELANVRPGKRALVHSAAGGVGGALTQLLCASGCEVVGVVRGAHKVAEARRHGAAAVIDKAAVALWPEAERLAPDGFTYVFDANGVETLRQSFDHLARPGKLVVYGFHTMLDRGAQRPSWPRLAWRWLRTPRFSPLQMTGPSRSVLAFNLSYLFDEVALFEAGMAEILAGLAGGRLTPLPVRAFPAERVADAHAALESGESTGKLVLTW